MGRGRNRGMLEQGHQSLFYGGSIGGYGEAMRTLFAIPVALTAVLAGCVSSISPPLASTDVPLVEAPALLHIDAARAEASAWQADARLVGLTATEGESIGDHVDPPLFWNTALDPDVGNGKALVWTYAFAGDAEGILYYVSIGAAGAILYSGELPTPYHYAYARAEPVAVTPTAGHGHSTSDTTYEASPPPRPVGPPTLVVPALDSDRAFAAASSIAAFAEFARLHPRHEVLVALASDGERPVWLLQKQTATYFGAIAAIDANTGDVIHSSSWPQPPTPCVDCWPCDECKPPEPPTPPPRPEDTEESWSASAPGRLSSGGYGGETVETSFVVASSYWFRDATIHIVADTLPGEWLSLRVLDPNGNPVWETSGSSVLDAVVPYAMEGVYTLEVRGDSPVLRDIPFESTIRVRYDEPGWRNVMTQMGMLAAFGSPLDMPFGVEEYAEALEISLSFGSALPTDGVRYRLEGPTGIVEEGEGTATDRVLKLDAPEQGPWRLTVWPTPTTVKPLDVSVVVLVAYDAPEPCCWM